MKPQVQRMMGAIYRDRVFRITAAYLTLGERLDDANDALNNLRKAFAIVAYHTWERGALRWFAHGKKKPIHDDLVQAFAASPYAIDKDGLRDLKDLVNCLKHNSTTSGPTLWQNRPDLFKPGFNPNTINPLTNKPPSSVDWEDEVMLVDPNMDAFFQVVRVSSPK